jgi:hypothetical protein
MTVKTLIDRAAELGLRLESRGDKLAVIPGDRVPHDFAEVLRQHKGELLDWFEGRAAGLAPDYAPWPHVAKQILAGEFDGLLDNSVRGSLETGLRSVKHPLCVRALARLNPATSGDRRNL